jgi:methionyl-tRNA formyltransferase
MNITLLANRDLASNLALNQLLPLLADKHQLSVFLSSHVGGASTLPEELEQLRFFEQTLFNDILFPALERGAGMGGCKTFAQLGEFTRTPVTTLNRINSEESLATLKQTSPDLVLCIRYGGILKEAAIALPEHGVINLHSGRLPDYRGVMASFRAMLNGDRKLGTTVHYISDAGIDTGDIIGTTSIDVQPGRSYLWHVLQLYPAACKLLAETVELVSAASGVPQQPQPAGGNYYSFPTTAELALFRERGNRLFDVAEIHDFARYYMDAAR